MVVIVFLLGYGFQDFQVTVILDIVASQYRNTETNLFTNIGVVIYIVFLDELLVLELLDRVILGEVDQLLAVQGTQHMGFFYQGCYEEEVWGEMEFVSCDLVVFGGDWEILG